MRSDSYSWFKLMHATGFGAKSMYHIYSQLQVHSLPIKDIFRLREDELQELFPEIGKGKLSKAQFANLGLLDDDLLYAGYESLRDSGVEIIPIDDELYPQKVLDRLQSDAPPILFCKGNSSLLNKRSISIIGSRNVSEKAVGITKEISAALSKKGFNIVSGNAKGTDKAAHSAALESEGTTTMILPQGLNGTESNDLDWRSEDQTLLVSQFLPNAIFRGPNAMLRNKLIVASSEATFVITSGPQRDATGKMSGTFDGAKSALEMKIPVYVLSPKSFDIPPLGNSEIIALGGKEIASLEEIKLTNTPAS